MQEDHAHGQGQHGDGHCCQGKGAHHEGKHGEGKGHCGHHQEHAHASAGATAADTPAGHRCCRDKG